MCAASRRPDPATIAQALSDADPSFASLISIIGPPPRHRPIPIAKRFESLATSILHQQLAGAAAATITGRVVSLLEGAITPEGILATDPEALRACGVSGAKQRALTDLAEKVAEGTLDLSSLGSSDDETVITSLVNVRGIGQWTAEMFLMGPLGRLDVWPTGDLGVRNGWALIQSLPKTPTPRELHTSADRLRPHRSAVAWYCWQAVDLARTNGGVLPR